jgi:Putative MetA-pathway of phenol degradation
VVALSAGLGCAVASPPVAVHAAGDALPAAPPANGSPAGQDAELRRVAAHQHRVLAEGDATAAAAGVPMPRPKPLQRDRSDQVVALLARAGPAQAPSPAAPRTLAAGARQDQGRGDQGRAAPSPAPDEVEATDASAPAAASEAIAELRDELEARDLLIANLLQRVEQLERRIVLSAPQLDQAVGGAGPVSLMRRPVAAPAPPAAAGAAIAAGASEPVRMAQAQPLVRPEEEAAPPATTEDEAAPPATTEGEAAQAPGQFEVEEEAIDRALERTLVQEGVLLLPLGQAEIEPSFTYTRREFDTPTFVTIDGDTFVGEQEIERNEFETGATLRVGLPFDSQVEVGIPYNYVDESVNTTVGGAQQTSNSESGHGFGDVSLGLAKTLLQEGTGWWPDVIARVTWDADTGKTDDNGVFLGGGFNELSGSLSAVKRQDPLAFVGNVSYAKTFEHDDIEPGDEVGFSLGTVLAASPETSLSFFFNQSFADDTKFDGDTINGSDQVIGTLSLGAATILGRNVLLSITGEIGLTDDAPDYAIGASLPIRFDLPTF